MKTTLLKKIVKLNPIFSLCLLSNLHAQTLPNTVKAEITQSHSDSLAVCTASLIQLSNKSGDEFNTFLSELDPQCFNKIGLIEKKVQKKIITSEKILSIIDASKLLLENLNEANQKKLTNYAKYLNTSIKINKQHIGLISNFHNLQSQVKSKIHDITYNYAHKLFNKNRTPELKELSHEVFSLINNWETQKESLSLIEYITNPSNHLSMISIDSPIYDAIIPIQRALKIANYYGNIYKNNKDKFNTIYNNIKEILKNLDSQKDINTYSGYINVYGEFLRYQDKKQDVINTLKLVLKNSEKNIDNHPNTPNLIWIETVNILDSFNIAHPGNCQEFIDKNEQSLCDVKFNMNNELFQNSQYFEDGQIVIHSSLAKEDLVNLYHSMKQVEAVFKSTFNTFVPNHGFKPKRLQIYIFPSKEEYLSYKNFMSNLSHQEDGGIYIDQTTSIFIYNEEQYLENYLLHEYVHFLSNRYLLSDNFNAIHSAKYRKWLAEGLAVFFAGANEDHKFNPNKLTKYSIISSDLNKIPSILEIVNSSTYHSYTHSYALFNYLYFKRKKIFNEIIKAIKENNFEEYKKTLLLFAETPNENKKYKRYIKGLKDNLIHSAEENYAIKKVTKLFNSSDFNYIKEKISQYKITNTNCQVTASTSFLSNIGRFVCKGEFNNKDNILQAINILRKENSKFLSTSVSFQNNTYYIEGSLDKAEFELLPIELQDIINQEKLNDRVVTFNGSDQQTCVTFDSTCIQRIYEKSRLIDVERNYEISLKEKPETGEIKHISRGTVVFENTGTSPNDYNPISATLRTQEKSGRFSEKDRFYDLHLTFIKLLNYDERIFSKNIYVNKEMKCFLLIRDINELNRELSREYLNFSSNTILQFMSDYHFEIDSSKLPQNVYAEIFHNNTLCFSDNDIKSRAPYPIEIKVTKRDLPQEIVTVMVHDFDSSPNKVKNKDFIDSKHEKNVFLTLDEEGATRGWIYDNLLEFLNPKLSYNYQVIKNSKCNNYFILTNYGSYVYHKTPENTCLEKTNSDEIIIGVTEITPEKDRSFLKVKLNVNF